MPKSMKINSREIITNALKDYVKKHDKIKRSDLFKPALDSLRLTEEEKKDRSSDGLYCKYRSLTGSIINELIGGGAIKIIDADINQLSPAENEKTIRERRKSIYEYLSAKYITDYEEKDKNNALKSIISDKTHEKELLKLPYAEAVYLIEKKFIRAAKIEDSDIEEKFKFPNTLVGACLRNQYEKYQKYLAGGISYNEYQKSLSETLIKATYENGGAFFEKVSLDLIKAVYADDVVPNSDKITGGPSDYGIDGELKIKDKCGFIEKVVIQAKLNSCGEKLIREFMGSMSYAGAQKGIFITLAVIDWRTREFAKSVLKTTKQLLLIGRAELLQKMFECSVGLKTDKYENLVIDNSYFIIQ